MSTVKISQLPLITALNANTSNSLFMGVDIPTGITGKFTAKTLAANLYSNEILNVGLNHQNLPNTVAQFALSGDSYIQTNLVNTNDGGTADIVVTANTGSGGTDAANFIDMGWANKNYVPGSEFNNIGTAVRPNDGYLYTQGTSGQAYGNLIIGTTSSTANLKFIVGGGSAQNIVARMTSTGLVLNTQSSITFSDGTSISTAPSTTAYTQAAFAKANTAVQNTAIVQLQALTLTGNLIANSPSQGIFVDTFSSNSATFSKNVTILGNLTSNTLAGNVFFSNVTVGTSQANSIQWFEQFASPTQTNGQVWYSGNTISLIQDTDVAGDRPAISKVLFERVYNSTSSTIPASSWVRLAGGVTSNSAPYIQLADATTAANSQVEGFVKVAIAAGAYGFIYTRGIVEGMDASTFGTNGQLLFLSTTPGQASNVAPTGANSVIGVAKILSNGVANGKLQIAIQSQQAYGKPNGSVLFANNNLIQTSNTIFVNEALGQLNVASTIYAANGIINRANTYPGTQTAITVNLTTETWVKANVGASLTITPTGFGSGLEAEVVVTNPNTGGGAARTITHGVAALNSSVGATSFTLGATTTAFVKYYSFDGDLANTYVKISYS
jgi:hypothetical protein